MKICFCCYINRGKLLIQRHLQSLPFSRNKIQSKRYCNTYFSAILFCNANSFYMRREAIDRSRAEASKRYWKTEAAALAILSHLVVWIKSSPDLGKKANREGKMGDFRFWRHHVDLANCFLLFRGIHYSQVLEINNSCINRSFE